MEMISRGYASMINRFSRLLVMLAALMMTMPPGLSAEPVWRHATALVGEAKYPEGFERFDYVNPEAPKGGTLKLSSSGSFDTLNPIPAKGDLAVGLDLVFETLMTSSEDEISSNYGLLAEAVRYPDDYSWVSYRLREGARWHDGEPVTAEDVVWSFEQTVANNPQREFYYRHVVKAEATGPREITFTFDEKNNKELPKIVGELIILPKHWWESESGEPRAIDETTLQPVLGSGPYRIANVRPGDSMTFERVEDYWGADLNVNVGQNNFDQIIYTYFADRNVEFEAFKSGNVDFWQENEAKRWANAYDFPAVEDGRITREEPENLYRSSGVLVGFIPNLRRDKFKDPRVRQALNFAYNFEDQNRTCFSGSMNGSTVSSTAPNWPLRGLPQGRELEILKSLRGKIPESVFTTPYENPVGGTEQDVQANMRANLPGGSFAVPGSRLHASRQPDGQRRDRRTLHIRDHSEWADHREGGASLCPEPQAHRRRRLGPGSRLLAIYQPVAFAGFRHDLFRLGTDTSPGNEQAELWGSQAAELEGSANYAGIADPPLTNWFARWRLPRTAPR
jgi:microcin C transport system substrate-binding protein